MAGRGNKKQSKLKNDLIWYAGIYTRRSFDDNEDKESNTIVNQKSLIKDYVEKFNNIKIIDYYVDDGYTGTDFNRPAFKNLLEDVKDGKINTIIVKDLSRLGRNSIEVGKYIEDIFPLYNLRLIAINDDIDSYLKPESINNLIFPLKNLINESYARDISKKVSSAYLAMAKKGQFVAGTPPYGYKLDSEDKHHLVINEEEANIVKEIFKLAESGHGKIYICKYLNDNKILCRKELQRRNKENIPITANVERKYQWGTTTIGRMLENEVYVGNLVQLKTYRKSFKDHRELKKEKEDWIRCDNTHDPIISKSVFIKVQKNIKNNTKQHSEPRKFSIYNGVLKCADCGKAMLLQQDFRGNRNYSVFKCSTSLRVKNCCKKIKISEHDLNECVIEAITLQVKLVIELEKSLIKLNIFSDKKQLDEDKNKYIKLAEIKINNLKEKKKAAYEDWKFEKITKLEYLNTNDSIENEIRAINNEIELYNSNYFQKLKMIKKNNYWLSHFKRNKKIKNISKNVINELIDSIYVGENGNIKIIFKYQDEYEKALNYINNEGVNKECVNGELEFI